MSNIVQPASWADVPLLETTTPVLGGEEGPMNFQAKALVARTEFLDDKIDALDALDIANTPSGSVQSSTVQDAINELGSEKAPLNSPSFNGTVTGITASMVGAPSGSGTSTGTNTGDQDISGKQNVLVSGTSIKTINGTSILGSGDIVVVDPSSTDTLTNKTVNLANNTFTVDGTNKIGYLNVPQNSQSTAYTLVLADAGKHILHPSADTTARTFTIPANASVAFPIGTAITFINQNAAGVLTIAITTDTMRLAKVGTTGSRTLEVNGVATALKLTSTEWIISGTGLL